MDERWHRVDGFQTASGLLAVIAGPMLLANGAPAGWSVLIMAAGCLVVAAQWIIAFDVRFEAAHGTQLFLAATAMALFAIAAIYLTRAANDLPSLFPGHDGDSENFRILPGVATLAISVCSLGCAIVMAHPTRATE